MAEITKGLRLSSQHCEMVHDGRKRSVVRAQRFDVAGEQYVLCSDKAYGVVEFSTPEEITLTEFAELRNVHHVSDDERKERWPDAKSLWYYHIKSYEPFDELREYAAQGGSVVKGYIAKILKTAQRERFPDDVNAVIGAMEGAGISVTHAEPGGNHDCARCGHFTEESRFGACFACAMLEGDPESTDDDILWGLEDLADRKISIDAWYEGRKRWGKLVPSEKHVKHIKELEASERQRQATTKSALDRPTWWTQPVAKAFPSDAASFVAAVTPDVLSRMQDGGIGEIATRLSDLWQAHFASTDAITSNGLNREAVLNAALFVLAEWANRKRPPPRGALWDAAREMGKGIKKQAIFGSPAGKARLAKKLAALLPPHKIYVEPFCGSAAVLFAKEPSEKEVINDFNEEIAQAHRDLKALTKDESAKLKRMNWTCSREAWDSLKKLKPSDRVTRLHRFLYLTRFSMGAIRTNVHVAALGKTSKTAELVERLAPRLKTVKIYNSDWEAIVQKYDSKDTTFYFDPPYVGHDAGVGESKFDEVRFFNALKSLRGKFLLTYGARGELPKMLRNSDFKLTKFETARPLSNLPNVSSNKTFTTIVAANYDADFSPLRKSHAPVNPGSEAKGEPIKLDQITGNVKPIKLRRDAVCLVGSVPSWGEGADADILVKGPLDDATRHVVNFRLGRMYPPEISQRLSFHDDDLGGPFTTHVPLYDLYLVPKTCDVVPRNGAAFEKIEMAEGEIEKALEKQRHMLEYPKPPNKPVRSVWQLHARGKSIHYDWRIALTAKELVGWTISAQKAGQVKRDIETVADARSIGAGLTLGGNRYLKPLDDPAERAVLAVPKRTVQPPVWLGIDAKVFPPGEAGATPEEEGVIISVDRPFVQFGFQENHFHEYFCTRGKQFNGTVFVRMLVGRGGPEAEREAGRVTPRGEVFWRFFFSPNPLPSVLRTRSVREKRMPPDGVSAVPRDLMALVPAEYRFWEHKGAKAREVRDALVASRYFTEKNVRVVGGKYVRVEKKYMATMPARIETDKAARGKFRLVWQYWKRKAETIRAAPSREVWHLLVAADGKKYAWTFQQDPSAAKSFTAVAGRQTADDWTAGGEIKPSDSTGIIRNETKATPSWAQEKDAGTASVRSAEDGEEGSLLVELRGEHTKRTIYMEPEEPGSEIWIGQDRTARKSDMGPLADDALIAFTADGPAVTLCGECGADRFERLGDNQLAVCRKCGATVKAADLSLHPWEVEVRDGRQPKVMGEFVAEKAASVPELDDAQVWDPDRKARDVDRKQLKPLAIFKPMKPRDAGKFFEQDKLLAAWKAGGAGPVFVEPKWNGRVIVVERDDAGKTLLYFEDTLKDKSHVLPTLTKELKRIPGGAFALVGELLDRDEEGNILPRRELARFGQDTPQEDKNVVVKLFRAVYADDRNLTAEQEDEQYKILQKFVKDAKSKHLELTQRKLASTEAEIKAAIKWATKIPGSEGAMVKDATATYTLGGFTSSWTALKAVRPIRAIVLSKERKKPPPTQRVPARTWVYRCGVGPIPADEADEWKETAEHGGKTYVVIGKTAATNIQAKPGDTLLVNVLELHAVLKDKKTVHWFGPPMPVEVVSGPPMKSEDVIAVAHAHEIEKTEHAMRLVPIGKGDDFQGLAFGIVYKPNDGVDGPLDPDTQDDVTTRAEIEKAYYWYQEYQRTHPGDNVQHAVPSEGDLALQVVQEYLTLVPFWLGNDGRAAIEEFESAEFLPIGTWLREIKAIGEKLREGLKNGTFTGFSIEGEALKRPEIIEITAPHARR